MRDFPKLKSSFMSTGRVFAPVFGLFAVVALALALGGLVFRGHYVAWR